MGWLGDNLVLGQQPRKNGCICALAPLLLVLAAGGWGIAQVVM